MKNLNKLKSYINTDYKGYGKLIDITIGLMIEITVIPEYINLNNYIVDLLKSNDKIKTELALNLIN